MGGGRTPPCRHHPAANTARRTCVLASVRATFLSTAPWRRVCSSEISPCRSCSSLSRLALSRCKELISTLRRSSSASRCIREVCSLCASARAEVRSCSTGGAVVRTRWRRWEGQLSRRSSGLGVWAAAALASRPAERHPPL